MPPEEVTSSNESMLIRGKKIDFKGGDKKYLAKKSVFFLIGLCISSQITILKKKLSKVDTQDVLIEQQIRKL